MRALTVRQPWAWAIIHGGKTVENRTRNLAGSYRGPVAIHAGLQYDEQAFYDDMIQDAFGQFDDSWLLAEDVGQRGAFVGIIDLVSVHHDSDHGRGHRCSPWAQSDLWHNVLSNPRPLPEPIPARGMLGLWTPPADVLEQLQAVGR